MPIVNIPLAFSETPNLPEATQNAIQITKCSTNSYGIIDGQTAFVGPHFDTHVYNNRYNISIYKFKGFCDFYNKCDDSIQSPTMVYIDL